jgi:hypothetical protein
VSEATVRERPILFSAPMVRAILDGRKTQTRRIVKGIDGLTQPIVRNEETGEWGWWWTEWRWDGSGLDARHIPYAEHFHALRCPYGVPGDRLWVRESHQRFDKGTCDQHVWYLAGRNDKTFSAFRDHPDVDPEQPWPKGRLLQAGDRSGAYGVPSIHMARWASRITLEVAEVRVERLKDCSEADAIAEGIEPDGFGAWKCYADDPRQTHWADPRESYRSLWDAINGDGAWASNPWVWVVEFRRVEQEAKAA